NPLLPLPQQIHYGSGRLPIAGLEIGFAFSPTPQDRFAADELASGLLSRAKVTVQVSEGEARQRMVVLRGRRKIKFTIELSVAARRDRIVPLWVLVVGSDVQVFHLLVADSDPGL